MTLYSFFIFFTGICFFCCRKNEPSVNPVPEFDSLPVMHTLQPLIEEISGIADSKKNPGFLWAQEDGGHPPSLYLIAHDGSVLKSIYLRGITNRDWEELAICGNDLYLAETGDNAETYGSYAFYRFEEPDAAIDTVVSIETIPFTYPDGSHDSEAFLVDPSTKDIIIITKRDNPSRIYRLSYPYASQNTLSFEGELPYTGVVGAALSADGKEIIIKTYGGLRYYPRKGSESLAQSLQGLSHFLPYRTEPQGEAVCFAADGKGYFTLGERVGSFDVVLYFYKRK